MLIQTINPTTQRVLGNYSLLSEQEVLSKIDAADVCYRQWRKTSLSVRSQLMYALADLIDERKHALASLMADEMGKPVSSGVIEVEKCVWICRHYAEHAATYLAINSIDTEMRKSFVCYEPLGVVLGVMPWNFPVWQVFRYAVPTLMAGNATLLKHASICSGTGMAIEALFREAGFPEHLFMQLIMDANEVVKVIAHKKISAVTFTGSEQAGSLVASQAGRYLKKSVLELGGNDPYLVLEDADTALAACCIVKSRLNNCGQVCIAAKRVIVVDSQFDDLLKKIISEIKRYVSGDPHDPLTSLGPMARDDLRQALHQQVVDSCRKGANLVLGGEIPLTQGYYYPPTVLTDVKPGMPAFDEELFGPVIALIRVADEPQAIALANQTSYGLGAAIFTQDLVRAEHIARYEIEAGICFVNGQVTSDPRLPFGGIKRSGYGRELAKEGILEFVNTKTVCIK